MIIFFFLLLFLTLVSGNYPLLDVDTNMRIVLVPHDTPVGTIIYRLRASDSDGNFPLEFEILTALGKTLLSLDFLGCSLTEVICQADVVLMKPLDLGRTYEFQIRVRDTNGDFTKVPAVIQATEGTSVHSLFGPKILYVAENTPIGTQLEKFVVNKNELNSRTVLFELREPKNRIELKQKLLSNNRTEGRLLLKKNLDFESEPWFTFSLLAMNAHTNVKFDTRNVLLSEVIVAVVDSQDTPPFFTLFPTSVEIPKDIKVGDLVTRVAATDGDKQNKRLIRYGFLTESNPFVAFFDLDPLTGEIRLKRTIQELSTILGRPTEPIKLTILVEEIVSESEAGYSKPSPGSGAERTMANITFWLGSATALGPPTFSKDSYVAEVKEESLPGTPLEFDGGSPRISHDNPNELIHLTFGNFDTTFSQSLEIVPREGRGNFTFDIRIVDGKPFDFETVKLIKLDLVGLAASTGLKSIVELTLHIRDDNDFSPVFSQDEYNAEIAENSPKGTKVVQVLAKDKDTGQYGQVVYTNIQGSDAFHLDPKTGQITVERPTLLDRETDPEIRIYVVAKDGGHLDTSSKDPGGMQRSATSTVVIKLTDENDNEPTFSQKYYHAILTPDHTALRTSLQVKAFDLDQEDTPNSQVRYSLGPDIRGFYIDPVTGDLRLRTPFISSSAAEGPYLGSIIVKAHDMGNPQLSSESTVQIFSEDMVTREVHFVFPSSPDAIRREKDKIEKMLNKLTGGLTSIQNVSPLKSSPLTAATSSKVGSLSNSGLRNRVSTFGNQNHQQGLDNDAEFGSSYGKRGVEKSSALTATSDQSLVTAIVQFPVSDTPTRVDLAAWQKAFDGTTRETSASNYTAEIEIYKSENRVLFWVLIIFIVLLLLCFAMFLFCLYCPTCWLYNYCKKFDTMGRDDGMDNGGGKMAGGGQMQSQGGRPPPPRRTRRIYPDEPEDGDYPGGGPGYRREAWSGEDQQDYRGGGGQYNNQQRRFPQPPGHGRKMNNDVSIVEDWEFTEHGMGGGGEDLGQRWQGGGRRPPPGPGRSTNQSMANVEGGRQPNTRFYKTDAGEVLQFEFEGEEGKDMIMRRFISEQDVREGDTGDSERPRAAVSRRPQGGQEKEGKGRHHKKDKKSRPHSQESGKHHHSKSKKEHSHNHQQHLQHSHKTPTKSRSRSKSREKKGRDDRLIPGSGDSDPLSTENLLLATSYLLHKEDKGESSAIAIERESPSIAEDADMPDEEIDDEPTISRVTNKADTSAEMETDMAGRKESKDSDLLRILEAEDDEDSGVGNMGVGKRSKMLEKKSIFTIKYEDQVNNLTSISNRPDTSELNETLETV